MMSWVTHFMDTRLPISTDWEHRNSPNSHHHDCNEERERRNDENEETLESEQAHFAILGRNKSQKP